MNAPVIARCPVCNQPIRRSSNCTCGHSDILHDIARNGKRTTCSEFNGKGRCGCKEYVSAEVAADG